VGAFPGGTVELRIRFILSILIFILSSPSIAKSKADDILLESDEGGTNLNKELPLDESKFDKRLDAELEDANNFGKPRKKKTQRRKQAENSSTGRKGHYDWTTSTPLWFHSFQKSSFTISGGAYTTDLKIVGNVSQKELIYKQKDSSAEMTLAYTFENPFFISLTASSLLQKITNTKFTDSTISYIDPIEKRSYEGISEPIIGFGGVWGNPDFSLGAKLASIVGTEPKKSEIYITSESKQQNVYNNTSGGAGINMAAFASYNYKNIIFDVGFDYTKKEKQYSTTVTTDYSVAGPTPAISKTEGFSEGQSNQVIFLGTEFLEAGRIGIHLLHFTSSEYSIFDQNNTEAKYDGTEGNGLALSAKLKVNPFFAIKPTLFYLEGSGGASKDPSNQSEPKISSLTIKLNIDLSF
jgi:hypothetical protein